MEYIIIENDKVKKYNVKFDSKNMNKIRYSIK